MPESNKKAGPTSAGGRAARGVIDILRRGFDNAIANWPLSLIRFSEVMLFGIIAVIVVIVTVIPLLVNLGIHFNELTTAGDVESMMGTLASQWVMLLWIFIGVGVMLLVFLLIHSFVQAGCAGVFVDADRAAGAETKGTRERYRVFSMERWMAAAKDGWWEIFWIYNLAWTAGMLVLLLPLIPICILVLVLRDRPGPAIAIGCAGLVLVALFSIVVSIVTAMWSNRAIVQWAADRNGIREPLGAAWRAVKSDLGRHLLVALAIFVVGMAGSSFFSSFSMFAAFGDSFGHRGGGFSMFTMPIRLIGSILNWAFSAMVGSWFMASYSALAAEKKP